MKCEQHDQQGFSLIEIMISLTIFLVLLAALVPLTSVSIQAWQMGRSRAEIQQTARLAGERLTQSIRYARNIAVIDNGGSLLIEDGDGSSRKFSVSPATKALCLTIDNGMPLPFAGDGAGQKEGRVVVVPNPANQQRFAAEEVPMKDKNGQVLYRIMQTTIVITIRDRVTDVEYTYKTSVVALNSRQGVL